MSKSLSKSSRSRAWLKNVTFFCRALSLFEILSESAVLLLWAVMALMSNVAPVHSVKQPRAVLSVPWSAAAPCWLGETYPQQSREKNPLLQSSSSAFFWSISDGFPLPSSSNCPSCENPTPGLAAS